MHAFKIYAIDKIEIKTSKIEIEFLKKFLHFQKINFKAFLELSPPPPEPRVTPGKSGLGLLVKVMGGG